MAAAAINCVKSLLPFQVHRAVCFQSSANAKVAERTKWLDDIQTSSLKTILLVQQTINSDFSFLYKSDL